MENNRQYNLRSAKHESVTIPVEIQTCTDIEYLNTLLNTKQTVDTVDSESDISGLSELDCSALVDMSDSSDSNPNKVSDGDNSIETGSQQASSSGSDGCSVQMLVNQQILSKLDQLGKRLDKLESTGCKKTSNPELIKNNKKTKTSSPTKKSSSKSASVSSLPHPVTTPVLPNLVELRQNATIQEQVQQRLEELTRLNATGTDTKIKSQRGGVDIFVKNRVRWPHEHVLSGSNKERISYDQLTILQWVTGFCRTIKEEQNSKLKEHMLDYMIALLEDAQDFSWGATKASHAVLLCRMEQGEIRNFSESEKIDRIRRANAQRHMPQTQGKTQNNGTKAAQKYSKTMPCQFFNQNTCSFQKTHETKGVLYRHVCSTCLEKFGKSFAHSDLDCKNKLKIPKND